jgi:hypothetical protein
MMPQSSHYSSDPGRRRFLQGLSAGVLLAPAVPLWAKSEEIPGGDFEREAERLLRDWCGGLLRQQILEPGQSTRHGAFRCPSCDRLHGRCGDAILPFLTMAARSGDMRYREAAMKLWSWMKNVDSPDGSWTNEPDPESWKGTTVFTSIALAETLDWHGELLDESTRSAMRERLKRAGEFMARTFKPDYSNINYLAAGAMGLSLLGRLLDEPAFAKRGRELAHLVLGYFTPKDRLLFGEGKPSSRRSAKGCFPVDLGYNVAESLPSLIHYAMSANDPEVLEAARASFRTHLEFMLPDGGWDNSWGTRSFKWTYWGSRTADGCQSALIRLAATDPTLGTAAWQSLRLLSACTHGGLLHGGPHYAEHGVPACVHHTFVQAKAVAGALHYLTNKPLAPPQAGSSRKDGIRHFQEVDVLVVRSGPWRASFSGYDWYYRPALKQATGGTPGMLWHEKLGPVLAASLAEYLAVEPANMQPVPAGCEEPVSCRVEYHSPEGELFSNIFDDGAVLRHEQGDKGPRIHVETRLLSRLGASPRTGNFKVAIDYAFESDSLIITARPDFPENVAWSLVVPVISRKSEPVTSTGDKQLEIRKPAGVLVVSSAIAFQPVTTPGARGFSLSPGFQVLPLRIQSRGAEPASCRLSYHA